jgi:hypothetical protein
MSSWGNYDNAANAPYWAVNSTIVNATNVKTNYAAPTAANVARLYANTTANVYTQNETIGLFAMDASEVANNEQRGVQHAGWVLKTTGQGGRAGRKQYETLVVLAQVNQDGDGTIIANTANP